MIVIEFNNWYYYGNGYVLYDELGEIFGLKFFLVGNIGMQVGGWFCKEIIGLEDFNGLKFCMSGFGGKVLGYMGVFVQNFSGVEVY